MSQDPNNVVPEESKDLVVAGMGDWVDTSKVKIQQPKGIDGCPLCDGKGQYYDKDLPGHGWGEYATGPGGQVICTRCTKHSLIQQRLLVLSHRDLEIVCDLVMRFAGKPNGPR